MSIIQHITLSDAERDHIAGPLKAMSMARMADPYQDHRLLNRVLGKIMADYLPERIKTILQPSSMLDSQPVLVLHNMPIDDPLPVTPVDGARPKEKGYVSEYMLRGIADFIHTDQVPPLEKYEQEPIVQVVPLHALAEDATRAGSFKTPLNWHTDNSISLKQPDYVLLCGLRDSEDAKTIFISVADLMQRLPESVKVELRKPDFISLGPKDPLAIQGAIALLTEEDTAMRFSNFKGITAEAKQALAATRTILKEMSATTESISISHGDLVIFQNNHVLHSRSDFVVGEKPEKNRWLQRFISSRRPPEGAPSYDQGILESTTQTLSSQRLGSLIRETLAENRQQ